jgi:hypothetical protein
MKIQFCFLVLGFLTSVTYAATVKITSFDYVRSGQYYAELCGIVNGATMIQTNVRILVDSKGNKPAVYNTFAGADGKFCIALITYRGEAEANIFGESTKVLSTIK